MTARAQQARYNVVRGLSELELLQIEMDLLWGTDSGPELVLAIARDGMRARVSRAVPKTLANSIKSELDPTPHITHLQEPPPVVERLRLRMAEALVPALRWPPAPAQAFS